MSAFVSAEPKVYQIRAFDKCSHVLRLIIIRHHSALLRCVKTRNPT